MIKKIKTFGSVFLLGFLALSQAVSADSGSPGALPTDIKDVPKWICGIADLMFTIMIVIGVVFILIAAFMYVTSQGNAESVEQANKSITYIAMGIAIATLATAIPKVLINILGGSATAC